MSYNILDDGTISSPNGFRATGVSGGLKEVGARDLALVYSQKPCRVAAVFTTNMILAAPVFSIRPSSHATARISAQC